MIQSNKIFIKYIICLLYNMPLFKYVTKFFYEAHNKQRVGILPLKYSFLNVNLTKNTIFVVFFNIYINKIFFFIFTKKIGFF